jgi:hypothetical protein
MAYTAEVLDIVELTPLRNSLVGVPGVSGLSVEQRKRLTIAVELVANPSVIFMVCHPCCRQLLSPSAHLHAAARRGRGIGPFLLPPAALFCLLACMHVAAL